MNAADGAGHHDTEAERREEARSERRSMLNSVSHPLPGVMDFIGANVDGELAEERWR